MTPEEINRTMEFILQMQARNEVSQEQHRETLSRHDKLLQQMAVQGKQMADLIVVESWRLDEVQRGNQSAQTRFEAWEKRHEHWEERHEDWRKRHDELMRALRNGIDRIIDLLGGVQ
jgi:hypothetical protein